MKDGNTKILIQVSTLLAEGYESEFENVIENIDRKKSEAKMPEGLKKLYDEVGNTPIDEPEIFKLKEEIATQEKSIIDLVLRFLDTEEMDKYSAEEVSHFAGEVLRKVSSYKDDNGVYKQTPNTEMWQRPKPSSMLKYDNLRKKIEGAKTNTEEMLSLTEEYKNLMLDTTGLGDVVLTDWEEELVVAQTQDAYKGYLNSFMGKR